MITYISKIPGFEGECTATWLNTNQVNNRLDGGVTGFFKLVKKVWWGKKKIGEEFHGIIKNGIVLSTST